MSSLPFLEEEEEEGIICTAHGWACTGGCVVPAWKGWDSQACDQMTNRY
jgi:hypothetical protein